MTILDFIGLYFSSFFWPNSKLASDDCCTAFPTSPVNSRNLPSTLTKFDRVTSRLVNCMRCGIGNYSQTRKEYWTGSSKMAAVASKFSLLDKGNSLSSYTVYRSVVFYCIVTQAHYSKPSSLLNFPHGYLYPHTKVEICAHQDIYSWDIFYPWGLSYS